MIMDLFFQVLDIIGLDLNPNKVALYDTIAIKINFFTNLVRSNKFLRLRLTL